MPNLLFPGLAFRPPTFATPPAAKAATKKFPSSEGEEIDGPDVVVAVVEYTHGCCCGCYIAPEAAAAEARLLRLLSGLEFHGTVRAVGNGCKNSVRGRVGVGGFNAKLSPFHLFL